MTTATDHPRARITALTLQNVAEVLATSWTPEYGVVEVLHDITAHDTFTRIVCERHLQESGIDVFWNDLVCSSAAQASASVAAVAGGGVNLEALYGPSFEAILGIIQAAVFMDAGQVASVGYQMQGYGNGDYARCHVLAREHGGERTMDRVLSDVQVAAHKASVTTPASLQRHLKGVRALELTAAYYVLLGVHAVMDDEFVERLTRPIRNYLWPDAPRL